MNLLSKFPYGSLVQTIGIDDAIRHNPEFGRFVQGALLDRYFQADWGEMDQEDIRTNNEALEVGDRLLASYNLPDHMKGAEGMMNDSIWIVTEWDRSATTILWPSEY
jgi:hypothetical protein